MLCCLVRCPVSITARLPVKMSVLPLSGCVLLLSQPFSPYLSIC